VSFVRLILAGAAALIAIGIALVTQLIPGWGRWYSHDLNYRVQTDAFLQGSVALDANPANLGWDWAWWDNKAQQVWGLGVPLFRLPFEWSARAVGLETFPDRFVFLAALAGTTYLLLRTFLGRAFCKSPVRFARRCPAAVAAPLLLVGHGPFFSLCRTRFNVYEEAQAYTYLFGVVLAALTVRVVRRPCARRYLSLFAAAAVSGYVRPTLAFCAAASLAVALLTTVGSTRRVALACAGLGACALGWTLLAYTNAERFGAPLEFGHSINLNRIDRMRFASRFGEPYSKEPLLSASFELFGALFLAGDHFNGPDWYASNIFPGQSSALRWRELYFPAYDLGTLLILTLALGWAVALVLKNGVRAASGPRLSTPLALAIWAAIAIVLLAAFYVRFPFLSSRYLLDFGPAFAAFTAVAPYAASDLMSRSGLRSTQVSVVGLGFSLWWCAYSTLASEIFLQRSPFSGPTAVSKRRVLELQTHKPPPEFIIPTSYEVGDRDFDAAGFNGAGWNAVHGQTKSAAVFYLREATDVDIEVGGEAKDMDRASSVVRARIGPHELQLKSVRRTKRGLQLSFRWPQYVVRPAGIQILFVGMTTPAELSQEYSRYRILQVRPSSVQ
jgi:hypothetical protein